MMHDAVHVTSIDDGYDANSVKEVGTVLIVEDLTAVVQSVRGGCMCLTRQAALATQLNQIEKYDRVVYDHMVLISWC